MNPVDKDIGRLIRKAREHMKLAPEDVAEELGISADQLLRIEFGEVRPTSYQLLCICALLRVKPGWFFPHGWNGEDNLGAALRRDFDVPNHTHGVTGDDNPIAAPKRPIEIAFPGGIRVVVNRDFDQIAFSKVVEVLRVN